MRIALVGTRGVPARYGGFETCVEEVGARLAERGHEVIVYTRAENTSGTKKSRNGQNKADRKADRNSRSQASRTYRGMRVEVFGAIEHKAAETLSHTGLSVAHLMKRPVDVALVFNAANAVFLPALRARRIPVATHVDGLEWKRAKWGGAGRRYYRMAESLAVRWSDDLIADARGIQDYYRDEFAAESTLIAYGAPLLDGIGAHKLTGVDAEAGGYHLVVARFEPENHVDMIVDGYVRARAKDRVQLPLLVVGAARYGDAYTDLIRSKAAGSAHVRFLDSVWDQELLDQLYANAATYVHGHSVGGTNPSLLRAMGAGAPTLAFDVGFNREVLGDAGVFFSGPADLADLLAAAEADPDETATRGKAARVNAERYDWDDVADRYEDLCVKLASGWRRRRQNGNRRTETSAGHRPIVDTR